MVSLLLVSTELPAAVETVVVIVTGTGTAAAAVVAARATATIVDNPADETALTIVVAMITVGAVVVTVDTPTAVVKVTLTRMIPDTGVPRIEDGLNLLTPSLPDYLSRSYGRHTMQNETKYSTVQPPSYSTNHEWLWI